MKKKLLSLVCALALTISLLPAAQALEGEGTRAAEALASLGLVTGTGAGGLCRREARHTGAGRRAARAPARCGENRKGRPPQLRLGGYSLLGAERSKLLRLS